MGGIGGRRVGEKGRAGGGSVHESRGEKRVRLRMPVRFVFRRGDAGLLRSRPSPGQIPFRYSPQLEPFPSIFAFVRHHCFVCSSPSIAPQSAFLAWSLTSSLYFCRPLLLRIAISSTFLSFGKFYSIFNVFHTQALFFFGQLPSTPCSSFLPDLLPLSDSASSPENWFSFHVLWFRRAS